MKALVHGGRVCEIAANVFPVAAPLTWVDCDETVTTSHTYIDGGFRPPRPSIDHEWNGATWAVPAERAAAVHNAGIDAQIRGLEESSGGYVRGLREFMLAAATVFKQQGGPDFMANRGMQNVKALDDQIKALRAQRQ